MLFKLLNLKKKQSTLHPSATRSNHRNPLSYLSYLLLGACVITACSTNESTPQKRVQTQQTGSATHGHLGSSQSFNPSKLLQDKYQNDRSLYLRAKQNYLSPSRVPATYPLRNYLLYEQLKLTPYLSEQDVKLFLLSEKNTYIGKQIRERWLTQLADSGDWLRYEQYYNASSASNEAHCNYYLSLVRQKRHAEAMRMVPRFWLSTDALPYNCTEALDTLRYSKQLRQSLVWERLHKVLALDKTVLASEILPFFNPQQQRFASVYLEAYNSPFQIPSYANQLTRHPEAAAIFTNLIARQANTSIHSATDTLRRHPHIKYNSTQRRFIDKSFTKNADLELRPLLRERNWYAVKRLIGALPNPAQAKPKWTYWLARAHQQTGNRSAAASLFAKAATHRDYYGYLAADKVRRPYQLVHKNAPVSQQHIMYIAQRADIQRAVELYRLGELQQARREWRFATRDFKELDMLAAAKIAQQTGWHQQAIFTIAKAFFWDDTVLRFPLAHESLVRQHAAQNGIDSNWVYAIIRQESAFGYDANSHVGASGLMQLMPATAALTARKVGLPYSRHRLHEVGYNINLGSAYLAQMSDQFSDNRILASAAYNAGPGRSSRWLRETTQTTPADIWIENIPFKETRKYVKNVLFYTVLYGLRRGERVKMLQPHEEQMSPYL